MSRHWALSLLSYFLMVSRESICVLLHRQSERAQGCPRSEAHPQLGSALSQNTGQFVSEDVIP